VSPCYKAGGSTLEDFRRDIVNFTNQKASIGGFYTRSDVGIVRINSVELQKALLPSPIKKLEEMSAMLPHLAKARQRHVIHHVGNP